MLVDQFLVDPKKFKLSKCDPDFTGDMKRKDARQKLAVDIERMRDLQDRFYAAGTHSLLLVLQARDAAGKDSTIKHVLSGLNPSGCDVYSYKSPSSEELDHGYLWRHMQDLPRRGHIGIFNRSYYEEVTAVRVHPEFLAGQRIPADLVTDDVWDERFEDINAFERYLTRNGTRVVKFFLNVSRDEQKARFMERIENPAKHWKFSNSDMKVRGLWDEYDDAFDDALRRTSTKHAPWYVVPADHKWFTRLAVADIIVNALESIDPRYPAVTDGQREGIGEAREILDAGD
jgi:PPK2 family polyphosphate:nucleotide phosphotransferase